MVETMGGQDVELKHKGMLSGLRKKIKESIYGQEHSDKNAASRWVAEKIATPEEMKQDEVIDKLENLAQRFDNLWNDPQQQDRMERDDYNWAQRSHSGNYQTRDIRYKDTDAQAKFSAWNGIIDSRDYWGNLNRVDGYIGSGEVDGQHYSSGAYFGFDVQKPLVGPDSERRMVEVTLSGGQLLPETLREQNIEGVKLSSDGLETHVNQFDERLSFSDRTKASVWYTAGTKVDNKHFPDKQVVASPHGPIHEVRLLVHSSQPTWSEGATHIEGDSDWIKMQLGDNGEWMPAEMSDKWARQIALSGETLENGDVKVEMKVGEETKETVLHKVDLGSIVETSQNLAESITE